MSSQIFYRTNYGHILKNNNLRAIEIKKSRVFYPISQEQDDFSLQQTLQNRIAARPRTSEEIT
jgi:hypothetical protein